MDTADGGGESPPDNKDVFVVPHPHFSSSGCTVPVAAN
jgi:hypothetical protein